MIGFGESPPELPGQPPLPKPKYSWNPAKPFADYGCAPPGGVAIVNPQELQQLYLCNAMQQAANEATSWSKPHVWLRFALPAFAIGAMIGIVVGGAK